MPALTISSGTIEVVGSDLLVAGADDLAPAITDAFVPGPALISGADVELTQLGLEVVDVSDLATVLSTLGLTFARRFEDKHNDVGAASFSFLNGDDDAVANVQIGSLVNFRYLGMLAFTMLVESMHRVRLSPSGPAAQITTAVGRSHLALWEEAVVYPARGVDAYPIEEDRVYNWTAPSSVYDDSSWGYATSIGPQSGTFAYWTGLPSSEWPDPTAEWIWASIQDPSYPPLDEWSPAGPVYFRFPFDVPAGVSRILVYLTTDATGKFYIDGAQIMTNEASVGGSGDPTTISTAYVDVSAGERVFAAEVINDVDPEADMVQNPGGMLVAIYAADAQGNATTLLAHSDGSWKVVEYPPHPPGMTPGQVIRVALEEAQARGALPGLTLGFSDVVDSAGVAWPEVADIATKVGTSYLTFLLELTVGYIDLWMQPGSLVLHAWNRDGRGAERDVDLHAPTSDEASSGNIYELTHTVLG